MGGAACSQYYFFHRTDNFQALLPLRSLGILIPPSYHAVATQNK